MALQVLTDTIEVVTEDIATKAEFNAHVNNSEVHVTAEEKNKLNDIENGANKTIVDSELSSTSQNPVQNKVVTENLDAKAASDLSNVDNETFKAKVEASGFTSGTQVQICKWEATD